MSIKLVVRGGKLSGREIPIRTNQFVIGRDETCQLRPNSNMVSKLHCAIIVTDDSVWLRDLKSTNGTFCNSQRVTDRVQLHHGDQIQVGPLVFEIHMPGRPKPAEHVDEVKTAQPPVAPAMDKPVHAKKKSKVDDSDVFEWLSESGEEDGDLEPLVEGSDHEIGQQQTIADINISETVPELNDFQSKVEKPPAAAGPEDSSSAAANLLKGIMVRKRT